MSGVFNFFLRISGVADETSRRGRVSAGQGGGNSTLGCIVRIDMSRRGTDGLRTGRVLAQGLH
ncbi:MAG: hypothetical protein MPK75_07425, partial [Alphaproteobacteria bacterium]|nr:hypothetical protein [Alphaproteobacteria bacterium]